MPKVTPVDYDTVVPGGVDGNAGTSAHDTVVEKQQVTQEVADEIFRKQGKLQARALESSMAATEMQSVIIPNFSGIPVMKRPLFMPSEWPLNIVFFRKIYSRLRLTHPKGEGVDLHVFQSRVERLFKVFGNKNVPKEVARKDKDGSGWISWQECCECWREEDFCIKLSFFEQVYFTFDQAGCASSIIGWLTSTLIMIAIAISSCMFLLSSMPAMKTPPCARCEPKVHGWFAEVETVACILFTAEYVIRFLCVHSVRMEFVDNETLLNTVTKNVEMKLATGVGRTLSFLREPSNMIDLLAILPCWVTALLPKNTNLTVLRLIRLSRVFRVLKMGNLTTAKDVLTTTMEYSWPSLSMVLFIIIMWVLVFSVLVYLLEMGEWDEQIGAYVRRGEDSASPFTSIPSTFWWTIVTVTTVGYGDYAPILDTGRAAGTITIIGGVIAFAMPVGIIASQFDKATREYEDARSGSGEKVMQYNHEKKEIAGILQKFGCDGRTEVRFEVHDFNPDLETSGFMGFAAVDLRKLNFSESSSSSLQMTMPLQEDLMIAGRKAAGKITISLHWQPESSGEPAEMVLLKLKHGKNQFQLFPESSAEIPLLRGKLTVEVHHADGLKNISHDSNAKVFVRVCLCPVRTSHQPQVQVWDTQVAEDFGRSVHPVWGAAKVFNIDWASTPSEEDPERIVAKPVDVEPDSSLSDEDVLALMSFPAKRIAELQNEVLALREFLATAPKPSEVVAKRGSFIASQAMLKESVPPPEMIEMPESREEPEILESREEPGEGKNTDSDEEFEDDELT